MIRKLWPSDWNEIEQVLLTRTNKIQLINIDEGFIPRLIDMNWKQLYNSSYEFFGWFDSKGSLQAFRKFLRWPDNYNFSPIATYTRKNGDELKDEVNSNGFPKAIIDLLEFGLDFFEKRHFVKFWVYYPTDPNWKLFGALNPDSPLIKNPEKWKREDIGILTPDKKILNLNREEIKVDNIEEINKYLIGGAYLPVDQYVVTFTNQNPLPWPEIIGKTKKTKAPK